MSGAYRVSRDEFLTDTKGTGILNSIFSGYEPYRGIAAVYRLPGFGPDRKRGSYALFNLEPRGHLLITPGTPSTRDARRAQLGQRY